jgi:uncharacterized protein YjiS (DUF1127 family)
MREYALNQAISLGEYSEYGKIPPLRRLFRNWKARRRLSVLADCDDSVLRTIGVTREQVHRAMALPLTINAERALEAWTFRGVACEDTSANVKFGQRRDHFGTVTAAWNLADGRHVAG